MRRIITVAAMLLICIGVSLYTIIHVNSTTVAITEVVNSALEAIDGEDKDSLARHIENLCDYWEKEEDHLIHLIRHAQIDDITKSIARLRALRRGEDYSELAAELESIRWQINHINRSERMIFSNLL